MTDATPMPAADPLHEVPLLGPGELAEVEDGIRREMARRPAGALPADEGLSEAVEAAFSEPVLDILLGAWTRWAELREYADPKKYDQTVPHIVPLARHTVSHTRRPEVTLLLNGQEFTGLTFDLTATVDIEAITLAIKAGRIIAVSSGKLQASFEVKLAGETLVAHKMDAFELPGKRDLGEGYALL